MTHPAEVLDLFAQPRTDDGESLLAMAERAAWEIIRVQGSFTVGEVRASLGRLGLLANDGREKLDCLGALGRRMGCHAGGVERQSAEIGVAHRNRGTRWYPARIPAPPPDLITRHMTPQ